MKFKIDIKELTAEVSGKEAELPLYSKPLLNLANSIAQGTRPRTVGQLTELIEECPDKTFKGWKKWYLHNHSDKIDRATEKITAMVNNFKEVITKIDKNIIKNWAEKLVLEQTYLGLRIQEKILKTIANHFKVNYKPATTPEEKKNIDGHIGNIPVSVKPSSYKAKGSIPETINAVIIYYKKKKSSVEFEINPGDFKNYANQT